MDVTDLRVALFSGNYNYVRDGANQALNRLVEYLLRQGAQVRVYSPKVECPAFEPAGELVGLPNWPIPGRSEYRMPLALWLWVYVSCVLANAVFLGRPSVALVGGIVMGLVAIPLMYSLVRDRA